MIYLAGDIGGTNTRLLLSDDSGQILGEKDYRSGEYEHLSDIVSIFLDGVDARPDTACFAVAGPVVSGTARVTNLTWFLSEQELSKDTGIPRVSLINDFQAIGYGLSVIGDSDFLVLQKGMPAVKGIRVLLGAGTGLGVGQMFWCNDHYEVLPSEGGHMDFAPVEREEHGLLNYMTASSIRPSYDEILSGRGLYMIYQYLRDSGSMHESKTVQDDIKTKDPAAVISYYGLNGEDSLCEQALELFVNIYGALAGNLALVCMATGGVYIAGGITPKIISQIQKGDFMRRFNAKTPMEKLLATMPVKVVMQERTGLMGALAHAKTLQK